MKIKISKENLSNGIQIVQNIVSSKSTLPILSNMLLETKKDVLKLNTTDLDINPQVKWGSRTGATTITCALMTCALLGIWRSSTSCWRWLVLRTKLKGIGGGHGNRDGDYIKLHTQSIRRI